MFQALASRFGKRMGLALLACSLAAPTLAQTPVDPHKLLAEADRLAWLRAWTRAEPLYAQARAAFTTAGDERNALYAEVSRLRGQLVRPRCTPSRQTDREGSQFLYGGEADGSRTS